MPRKQQKFSGPVAHVAGNDVRITQYVYGEAEPPDDPAKSLQCPQCGRLTWRHTRHCVHCQLDLVACCGKAAVLGRILPALNLALGTLVGFGLSVAAKWLQ